MNKRIVPLVGLVVVVAAVAAVALWTTRSMNRPETDAERLGEPLPSKVKVVKIADLLQNPTQFRDQVVATEGRIGAIGCVDCGGVIVTDKTWRLAVEPEDPSKFRIPLKKGAPIKMWGVVKVHEGAAEPSGEKQPVEADVELKVKGVELR